MSSLDLLAGIGGPVGITVDNRQVPLGSGDYPTYLWGFAPKGLATYRQLAALGLRPGGAQPVARVAPRRGKLWAEMYSIAAAVPQRPLTDAKRAALDKANAAKRQCPRCKLDAGYVIPRNWQDNLDCRDHTPAAEAEHQEPSEAAA